MSIRDNWFSVNQKGIPTGLIVFSNAASTPAGWTAFSAADDKMIIGAGDTYSAGDDGGSDVVTTYTGSTGSGAACSEDTYDTQINDGASGDPIPLWTSSAGSHEHDYGNATFIPEKNTLKLIKATINHTQLPVDAVVIGEDSFSGLSIINADGKYIAAASSIGAIAETASLAISSAGSHEHWNESSVAKDESGSNYLVDKYYNVRGAHNPSIDLTITENIKKVLLSLWTHASAKITPKMGMIAMWESTTVPPAGWQFCNGANDAPDLRDCFIQSVANESENSAPTGDHTVDIAALNYTETHNVSHTHLSGTLWVNSASDKNSSHGTKTWTHTHTISQVAKSDLSWLPPYYALSFVQKIRD